MTNGDGHPSIPIQQAEEPQQAPQQIDEKQEQSATEEKSGRSQNAGSGIKKK